MVSGPSPPIANSPSTSSVLPAPRASSPLRRGHGHSHRRVARRIRAGPAHPPPLAPAPPESTTTDAADPSIPATNNGGAARSAPHSPRAFTRRLARAPHLRESRRRQGTRVLPSPCIFQTIQISLFDSKFAARKPVRLSAPEAAVRGRNSCPCSAWECLPGRSAAALLGKERRRRASGTAFPRGAWE